MDKISLLDSILYAAYFSTAKTVADNKDKNVRGWAWLTLIGANLVVAIAGGLITVPVSEILHLDKPQALVAASVLGWVGVGGFMTLLEKKAKERLEQIDGNLPKNPVGRSGPLPVQEDKPQAD